MILADKIMNERKKNGWSQEVLAEKLSVSRQSVSKWESAQSVPDLQKIIQMSEIFGVSTDYLLKDDIEDQVVDASQGFREDVISDPPVRKVTLQEANEYIRVTKLYSPKIALATVLCILSPVVLIGLAGISDARKFGISENAAGGIGIITLIFMVAIAVAMYIIYGRKLDAFKYIKEDLFETEYGVTGMAKEMKQNIESSYMIKTVIGVALCICCPLPLIVSVLIEAEEYIIVLMFCVLLIIVSAAVYLFIIAGGEMNAYCSLLQEGEFTAKEKNAKKKTEPLSGAYWMIITAIYLGVSFYSNGWSRTWIIWPVAGVLFAAISAVLKAVSSSKES